MTWFTKKAGTADGRRGTEVISGRACLADERLRLLIAVSLNYGTWQGMREAHRRALMCSKSGI